MKNLFLNLTSANILLLTIVVAWGVVRGFGDDAATSPSFDVLVVLTAVWTALVHSIFYTYFIAATRFVERAVEDHGYSDPQATDRAKRNKRVAFRYGFMAIVATVTAASLHFMASPVRQELAISAWWALGAAAVAVVFNLYGARKEWECLEDNLVLSDAILNEVTALREERLSRQQQAEESPG